MLVGGTFPNYSPAGVTPVSLLGGDGTIVDLNASGTELFGLIRCGSGVNDLEINAAGQLGYRWFDYL